MLRLRNGRSTGIFAGLPPRSQEVEKTGGPLPAFPCAHRLVFLCLLLTTSPAAAAPHVLATIKPIHSLVASVMQGVGWPELLVEGAASEHGYALKPSDARKIADGEVIFWVGPNLETFLTGPLHALAGHATHRDAGKPWTRCAACPPAMAGCGAMTEDDGPTDPHIWLDAHNAIAMVRVIAAELAHDDPANAKRYYANAASTIARAGEARPHAFRPARAHAPPALHRLSRRLSLFRSALRAGFHRCGDGGARPAHRSAAHRGAARRVDARQGDLRFPRAAISARALIDHADRRHRMRAWACSIPWARTSPRPGALCRAARTIWRLRSSIALRRKILEPGPQNGFMVAARGAVPTSRLRSVGVLKIYRQQNGGLKGASIARGRDHSRRRRCGSTCSTRRPMNAAPSISCSAWKCPPAPTWKRSRSRAGSIRKDGGVFMTALILSNTDSEQPTADVVTFVLAHEQARHHPLYRSRSPSAPSPRAASAPICMRAKAEIVLLGLLDVIIDRMADVLERAGAEIEVGLARNLQSRSPRQASAPATSRACCARLGRKHELTGKMRESLLTISRVLTFLTQALDSQAAARTCKAHIEDADARRAVAAGPFDLIWRAS